MKKRTKKVALILHGKSSQSFSLHFKNRVQNTQFKLQRSSRKLILLKFEQKAQHVIHSESLHIAKIQSQFNIANIKTVRYYYQQTEEKMTLNNTNKRNSSKITKGWVTLETNMNDHDPRTQSLLQQFYQLRIKNSSR